MCTHPVPEHIGGVTPTVLVMLLAAAVRNYFLLEGLVPVGVRYNTAALPLRTPHRHAHRNTHIDTHHQSMLVSSRGLQTNYNVISVLMSPFALEDSDNGIPVFLENFDCCE